VDVVVVDSSESQICAWNSGNIPIYEPRLEDILLAVIRPGSSDGDTGGEKKARKGSNSSAGNLVFSTNIEQAVQNAQIIFVCVNTPTKTSGAGSGFATDLRSVKAAVSRIVDLSKTSKIIVEKSTVTHL
jgi:UDPglucose 6-dehydrogenase